MNTFATLLFTLITFFFQVEAAPFVFTPSSPIFSLLALHNGTITNANVLTFNGTALKIGTNDFPFLGRIDAEGGYVLHVAATNETTGTNKSVPYTVVVDDETSQLVVVEANSSISSAEEFHLQNGLLSYANSTKFIVCSDAPLNRTLNTTGSGLDVYFNGASNFSCPYGQGTEVSLLASFLADLSFKRDIAPAASFPVKRELNGLIAFFKRFF